MTIKIPAPETGTGCVGKSVVADDFFVSPAHVEQHLAGLRTGEVAIGVERTLVVDAANHAEVVGCLLYTS